MDFSWPLVTFLFISLYKAPTTQKPKHSYTPLTTLWSSSVVYSRLVAGRSLFGNNEHPDHSPELVYRGDIRR